MQTFLRKYGEIGRVPFHLVEVDGVDFRTNAVCVSTDCLISKDEVTDAACINKFVDTGLGQYLEFTATEMTVARALVSIVDSATKLWLDHGFAVETYGNASAQHAMDFDTPVPAMVGTDDAALATAAAAIKSVVDAIPTTAMRGTDAGLLATAGAAIKADTTGLVTASAAIKSVVDGIPTTAMRGTDDGLLATAGAAIKSVVDAIPTTAMRGTDSGLLATAGAAIKSDTEAIITASAAIKGVVDAIPTTAMRGTDSALPATAGAAIKADTGVIVTGTSGIRAVTDALPNSGALTIDGVAYDTALTDVLAYVNGNIVKVGNTYTHKKRDNSTTAFVNTVSTSTRVRS